MAKKQDPAITNHVSGQSNKPISAPPHTLPVNKVVEELQTNGDEGLTPAEAAKRLEEYGGNEFGEEQGVQPFRIIMGQLANAMTLVCFSSLFIYLSSFFSSSCHCIAPPPLLPSPALHLYSLWSTSC